MPQVKCLIEMKPATKPFYITDGLNKIGPFSKDEVMQMLYSSHISITDFIVDTRDNRTCPLLQHEDFGGAGETHSITSSKGIAGLSPQSLESKFGFGDLRKQVHKDREDKKNAFRKGLAPASSHLANIIQQRPDLAATKPAPPAKPAAAGQRSTPPPPPATYVEATPVTRQQVSEDTATKSVTLTKSMTLTVKIDESRSSHTIKSNTSFNFFLKVKDKEFGPLKFLILLSLLKQSKISLDSLVRSEAEPTWKKLSEFVPEELQKTIHLQAVTNDNVLPKSLWKRKNVRVDYEEMVVCNNDHYSLVGKSIDLSAEGMAVIWVYDVPVEEDFELSFFDLEKNLVTVPARLVRREEVQSDDVQLYKAVFLFKQRINIKNFIG